MEQTLTYRITGDASSFTASVGAAEKSVSALKQGSLQVADSVKAMSASVSAGTAPAKELGGAFSVLKSNLGKVNPEMANFFALLDPNKLGAGTSALGAYAAAAGAALLVVREMTKAWKEAQEEQARAVEAMQSQLRRINKEHQGVAGEALQLLDKLEQLAAKENRTDAENGQLVMLIDKLNNVYGARVSPDLSNLGDVRQAVLGYEQQQKILANQQARAAALQRRADAESALADNAKWAEGLNWALQAPRMAVQKLGEGTWLGDVARDGGLVGRWLKGTPLEGLGRADIGGWLIDKLGTTSNKDAREALRKADEQLADADVEARRLYRANRALDNYATDYYAGRVESGDPRIVDLLESIDKRLESNKTTLVNKED